MAEAYDNVLCDVKSSALVPSGPLPRREEKLAPTTLFDSDLFVSKQHFPQFQRKRHLTFFSPFAEDGDEQIVEIEAP